MSSVNKVILVGNLGKDPEVRSTSNGSRIVNLTVATSESWKDKQSGERKEKTEWHRVVIFNDRLAEIAEKYLTKGSKIYIEGQLQTRKWTDNNNVEKYSTEVVLTQFKGEIVMLGDKGGGSGPPQNESGGTSGRSRNTPTRSGRSALDASTARNSPVNDPDDLDDAIPF